jgi:hypothetical protein
MPSKIARTGSVITFVVLIGLVFADRAQIAAERAQADRPGERVGVAQRDPASPQTREASSPNTTTPLSVHSEPPLLLLLGSFLFSISTGIRLLLAGRIK